MRMSVIFGIAAPSAGNPASGRPPACRCDRPLRSGRHVRSRAGEVGMGFQPFHTTERPVWSHSRPGMLTEVLLVLDGRLDSQADLRRLLGTGGQDIADSALFYWLSLAG